MNYVMHICRNKKCNNSWIDKDVTNVQSLPPSWKYCKECCEKLGIDFDKQRRSDYMTAKMKQSIEKNLKSMNK